VARRNFGNIVVGLRRR